VTFSFLIAAPMINEVALTLFFALFGWKIAVLYLGLGLSVAIVSGWIIGRLRMDEYLEDWVRDMPHVHASSGDVRVSLSERVATGFASVRLIVGKVWPHIVVGIAIGAAIHGYVPAQFMASFMGKEVWWAVPLAVVLGVPMYSNAAGIDARRGHAHRSGTGGEHQTPRRVFRSLLSVAEACVSAGSSRSRLIALNRSRRNVMFL
jgi:uncharacterized membrane protein YraQ (UPF0718 family)